MKTKSHRLKPDQRFFCGRLVALSLDRTSFVQFNVFNSFDNILVTKFPITINDFDILYAIFKRNYIFLIFPQG